MLMQANADVRLYWLCLVLVALLVTGALRAQEQLPIGFLDYLGGMVEQDGELLDPMMLDDARAVAAAQPVAVDAVVDAEKAPAQSSTDEVQEAP